MTPRLETKRLTLCPPIAADAGFVRTLVSDANVRQYLGGVPTDVKVDFASIGDEDVWIVHTDTAQIGMMSVGPHKDGTDWEVSYQFTPSSWGHGYAAEALTEVLDYVFLKHNLPRVIAETQKANARSVALLMRVGMKEVATLERFGATQMIFAIDSKTPHQ